MQPSLSISGAGWSLSRPRDSPQSDLFLAHVWLGSVSEALCFTASAFEGNFLRSSYPKKTLKLAPERITSYGFAKSRATSQSAQSQLALLQLLTRLSVPDRYKLGGRRKEDGGKQTQSRQNVTFWIVYKILGRDGRLFNDVHCCSGRLETWAGQRPLLCKDNNAKGNFTSTERLYANPCTVKDLCACEA